MRQRWDNRFVRSLKLLPIGKSELRSMFRPVDEHERHQLFVGDCVQHSEVLLYVSIVAFLFGH